MNKEEIEKLTETSDRSKSNTKRLDKLENKVDSLYELTLSVKEIATEMKAMRGDMSKMDDRVLAIEAKPVKEMETMKENMDKMDNRILAIETKPAKRWEGIVDKIMYTILGIVIAYIFKQFGM